MPRRRLTADEVRLWRQAMGEALPDPPVDAAKADTRFYLLGEPTAAAAAKRAPPRPAALDPQDAKAIRRGRIAIAARVDLHGMTQERAHQTLTRFLKKSAADGLRCVLVITGVGRNARLRRDSGKRGDAGPYAAFGAGVLRTSLPRWLEAPELAPLVIASAPAAPRDGGDGARYLLLRRPTRRA
jgi:DNA-nicking Smr family endonuclease